MRWPLRYTLSMLRDAGVEVDYIRQASRHTEVALWAGDGYRWLQVFTGDTLDARHRRRALAIEPMTCPPNAFASGTDLIILAPGASVTHSWGIQVTRKPQPTG